MPESNYYTNRSYSPRGNQGKKIALLSIVIVLLFSLLVGASVALFYYVSNRNFRQNGNNNASQTPLATRKYAELDDQKCKVDSEYENSLILTKDIDAYDRTAFYASSIVQEEVKTTISKDEKLFIELIQWEDGEDKKEALEYQGRALVCIKGKDKLGTVVFSTADVQLQNPVRYRDPERPISNVLIQAVYMVPSDADEKANWKTQIENNLKNMQKAHQRIFNNKSQIDYRIYPVSVKATDMNRNLLTFVANGIVSKENVSNKEALKPINYLNDVLYTDVNKTTYPDFFLKDTELQKYDQVTTLVYFEVGSKSKKDSFTQRYESGYAFLASVLDNGNFFGIIGGDFSRDISVNASPYHEFMHTLGLRDEYKYTDGTQHRKPTHLFKGINQGGATLMEDPDDLNLDKTYIDDQIRIMMGIQESN